MAFSCRPSHPLGQDLITGSSGAIAKQRLEQGFDMVSICTDVGSLAAEFDRQLAAVHGVEMGKGRSVY